VHVGEHVEFAVADRAHHAVADLVGQQPILQLLLERIVAGLVIGPAEARGPVLARGVDTGLHRGGREHRDADRRILQVVGDRFRQRHHGEFHRPVRPAAPVPADLEARDRGGVDDMAFGAVLPDQRQEGLEAMHHAHEIDADVPVPLLRRQLGDRAAVDRDAGIVAGDVQRSEFPDGGRSGRLHRGAIRHVGRNRNRLGAKPAHLRERRIEPVAADIAQHHGHPLARETARQAEPDPTGRARYDRGLAVQLLHQLLSTGARPQASSRHRGPS
jgi:hypothetical protein